MKKIVLVIEDEDDMRGAIVAALDKAGYHVMEAVNGKDGIEKAIEFEPDLILLDLLMPIVDGHTALKEIRKTEWGQNAKIVILTAMDDVSNLGKAYEEGITDYVTKSEVSLADLVTKVRETIGEPQ